MIKKPKKEFDLVSSFSGYRNREDKTNLPPGTLIVGSQNVLTNTSGRIGVRKGYTLDGAASSSISSVLASYDYEVAAGFVRNLRGCLLTSAGNDGKLQYRYETAAGVVSWRDLETAQTSTAYNFTRWWNATLNMSLMLFVNGTNHIKEWSGGITTIASVTTNTITNSGSNTWAQEGFYTAGNHSVVINGTTYAYTGGHGTHTLTGVTPDPTGVVSAGDIAHQLPESNTNASMSLALGTNWLIGQLNNHVYVGDIKNNVVYISKDTDYKVWTFTATRLPGEGAILTLNAPPKAFIPLENQMYVSSGLSTWGYAKFILSSDNTKEAVEYQELDTVPLQGSQSQALTTKIRNNILFLSNEPVLTTWGRVEGKDAVPQASDLSAAIVNDMNDYDFTNGSVFWHKNFIYVAVPAESRVLIFNMTDNGKDKDGRSKFYWEAPQIMPISRFYVVDGELYGHSYTSSESYKLFNGYDDNDAFIEAKAKFAYNSHGLRSELKGFNEDYIEGYISSNTTLYRDFEFDIDGCMTETSSEISGADTRIVCIGTADNSLGKESLGKAPLGANLNQVTSTTLLPKFRVIKTSSKVPYYEYSTIFRSNGVDQQWEVLAFGPSWTTTSEKQNYIRE